MLLLIGSKGWMKGNGSDQIGVRTAGEMLLLHFARLADRTEALVRLFGQFGHVGTDLQGESEERE